ncbi:MAG: PHP domain-containing protein [Candidatus Zixiibacteriota bacterium]|nr:MAG: PHP domain-containing protein [candidate division Zixibacteria bacterium]
MPDYIDLHMHTDCSDGLLSPEKLLNAVRKSGLTAFSVTDHDTVDGYRQVAALLTPDDPELVPGVELSVSMDGADMHMLAYLFDIDNKEFDAALDRFRKERSERGKQMIELLRREGVDIPYDDVEALANGGVIGRPHIAEAMQRSGAVKTFEEAFRRYIGFNGPAYVPKSKLTPEQAIALVHAAGGLAVMAHPFVADMYTHIERLVPLGLDGVEAYHYSHTAAQTQEMIATARKYKLVYTGGSDFHGRNDRDAPIGSQRVPAHCLEQLKERKAQVS